MVFRWGGLPVFDDLNDHSVTRRAFKRALVVIRLVGLDSRKPRGYAAYGALRVFVPCRLMKCDMPIEAPVLAATGGSDLASLSHRRLAQGRADDALNVGCPSQLVQCQKISAFGTSGHSNDT